MGYIINETLIKIIVVSSLCLSNYYSKPITPDDGLVVHGGFSPWIPITECSATCGEGFQVFARACTNPSPKHGGRNCEGPHEERRPCIIDCDVNDWMKNMEKQHVSTEKHHVSSEKSAEEIKPVNGGFTSWVPSTSCSASCGEGFQIFTRNCSNPAPKHGGHDCYGPHVEKRFCNVMQCDSNSEIRRKSAEDERNRLTESVAKETHGGAQTSKKDSEFTEDYDGHDAETRSSRGHQHKSAGASEQPEKTQDNYAQPSEMVSGIETIEERPAHKFDTAKMSADDEEDFHSVEDYSDRPDPHEWGAWTAWTPCPNGCKETKSVRSRFRSGPNEGQDTEERRCHGPCYEDEREPKGTQKKSSRAHHLNNHESKDSEARPPRVRNFEDAPQPPREPQTYRDYPYWKAMKDSPSPVGASTTPKSSNTGAIIGKSADENKYLIIYLGALAVGVVFIVALIVVIKFKKCKKQTKDTKTGSEKRKESREKASVERIDNLVTKVKNGLKGYSKVPQSEPNADRASSSKNDNRKPKTTKAQKSKSWLLPGSSDEENNKRQRNTKEKKVKRGKEDSDKPLGFWQADDGVLDKREKAKVKPPSDKRRNFSQGKLFDANRSMVQEGNITSASDIAIRR